MDELCRNYADALYGLTLEAQRQDVLDALSQVVSDLQEDEEFSKLLSSRFMTLEEKRGVLEKVYGKAFAKIPHVLSFLKVVSDHHRFLEMPGIYVAFRSLVYESMGVKEGLAYSAERLSKPQLASLEESIGQALGSKVSLTNVIDHRLLGGVKVSIDGKVFDGTLAGKLKRMHNKLNGGILG